MRDLLLTDVISTLSPSSGIDFESYAPVYSKCPNTKTCLRPANGLSPWEAAWLKGRKEVIASEFDSYLQRLNISGLDAPKLLSTMKAKDAIPTISVAISRGGWASGLTATGLPRAFDSQFPDAIEQKTGGLLQSLTYVASLSRGAWPVMSLATHNFPAINDLVAYCHTEIDRLNNPPNNSAYAGSFTTLFNDIAAKYEAGFNISVADYLR